ncbi:MAG: hypothetical protein QE274_10190 [Verrucomicrobiaceae bacterium]|nr:hypothetical protein [Verrucomicrobiaceae bacterium]
MKISSFFLVVLLFSTAAIAYWLARPPSDSSVNTVPLEHPFKNANTVSPPNAPSSEPQSSREPPLDALKRDQIARAKALIDSHNASKKTLPWERSDAAIEDFSRHIWESKRTEYIKLFNNWNLTAQQTQELEQILLRRDTAKRKLHKAADEASFLSPESKRILKETKENESRTQAEIATIVGDEKLQELIRFEDSKAERRTVDKLASTLESTAALDQTQEQKVMQSLYEVRKRFNSAQSVNTPATLLGIDYRNEVILELTDSLKPEQLTVLRQILEAEAALFEQAKKAHPSNRK